MIRTCISLEHKEVSSAELKMRVKFGIADLSPYDVMKSSGLEVANSKTVIGNILGASHGFINIENGLSLTEVVYCGSVETKDDYDYAGELPYTKPITLNKEGVIYRMRAFKAWGKERMEYWTKRLTETQSPKSRCLTDFFPFPGGDPTAIRASINGKRYFNMSGHVYSQDINPLTGEKGVIVVTHTSIIFP